MNAETYEQITLNAEMLSENQVAFLQDGMTIVIESHEDNPIGVRLPDSVTLTVAEADAVVKGQTASSSFKPALLENGIRCLVPPHIEAGTRIIVNTIDSTYVERAKD
jgi:elongation factor P